VEYKLGWRQHVKVLPRADVGKLIQAVAHDPLAMGIVDLAEMPAGEASVKVLTLSPSFAGATTTRSFPAGRTYGAAAPTRDKLPEGYWLSQPVDLWVSSQAGQPAKDFAEFLASGEGAATLQRHGLVPSVVPVKKAEPATVATTPAVGKKGR
jgi:hypothetical protein